MADNTDGYVRRGDRAQGYVSRGQMPSGYRRATGRINARITPETTRGFGGLNEFHALQNRDTRAFSDPRFPGQSAYEISQDLNRGGVRLGPNGRYSPDRNLPAREQAQFGPGKAAQRRAGRNPMQQAAPANPGIGDAGFGPSAAVTSAGGDRQSQRERPATQPRAMPTAADTAARAQEMRDERSMQRDMQNNVSRTMGKEGVQRIDSKYGTASVERNQTPEQMRTRAGTVKDDFGRMVPIKEETQRMVENQASKMQPPAGLRPGGQPGAPGQPPVAQQMPGAPGQPPAAQQMPGQKPGAQQMPGGAGKAAMVPKETKGTKPKTAAASPGEVQGLEELNSFIMAAGQSKAQGGGASGTPAPNIGVQGTEPEPLGRADAEKFRKKARGLA